MTTETQPAPSVPLEHLAVEKEPDLDLAQKAGNGDMEAFEELYKRHHRRVYSICLRMLQNAPEAEDLTQDVFIQLHRKIGSFRGDSAFTTWSHRLTVNQVLMYFRKRKITALGRADNDFFPETIAPGSGNPRQLKLNQRLQLNDALAEMPEGYKKVFVLHDLFGYEHKEIAEILGCSMGTSKSQLYKARLKLRKLVNKQANPRLLELSYE